MSYIIEDLTIFDELRTKQHTIKDWTYYNAKKWKQISNISYNKICDILGRKVKAQYIENKKWFSIDLYLSDYDIKKKKRLSFRDKNPDECFKQAMDYLSNPDNLYDIRRDDNFLDINKEINEDYNETLEWELQDNSN